MAHRVQWRTDQWCPGQPVRARGDSVQRDLAQPAAWRSTATDRVAADPGAVTACDPARDAARDASLTEQARRAGHSLDCADTPPAAAQWSRRRAPPSVPCAAAVSAGSVVPASAQRRQWVQRLWLLDRVTRRCRPVRGPAPAEPVRRRRPVAGPVGPVGAAAGSAVVATAPTVGDVESAALGTTGRSMVAVPGFSAGCKWQRSSACRGGRR